MANLLKYGKRSKYLPRIEGGRVHVREEYAERTPDLPDRVMPPMLYSVEVSSSNSAAGESLEYKAQFTEDEMLEITSEWLTLLTRRNGEKKRKAREYAERNK